MYSACKHAHTSQYPSICVDHGVHAYRHAHTSRYPSDCVQLHVLCVQARTNKHLDICLFVSILVFCAGRHAQTPHNSYFCVNFPVLCLQARTHSSRSMCLCPITCSALAGTHTHLKIHLSSQILCSALADMHTHLETEIHLCRITHLDFHVCRITFAALAGTHTHHSLGLMSMKQETNSLVNQARREEDSDDDMMHEHVGPSLTNKQKIFKNVKDTPSNCDTSKVFKNAVKEFKKCQ